MVSQTLIDVIGWVYFAAWSLSFYGQFILNFRLKNVEGMNLDFLAMNLTGFTFYSIYNSYGYFSPNAGPETGQVDLNDVLFSYHALLITILTVIQAFVYPQGKNRIMKITVVYLVALWLFCIIYGSITLGAKSFTPEPRLSVISFMGYFKLSISFLKYLPQMYWNWKRKSTVGWSIANILLDFTGGFFSFLQLALEAIDGQQLNINPVKLALAIMSMIYDIIFVVQHYCLYPQRKIPDNSLNEEAYHAINRDSEAPEPAPTEEAQPRYESPEPAPATSPTAPTAAV